MWKKSEKIWNLIHAGSDNKQQAQSLMLLLLIINSIEFALGYSKSTDYRVRVQYYSCNLYSVGVMYCDCNHYTIIIGIFEKASWS